MFRFNRSSVTTVVLPYNFRIAFFISPTIPFVQMLFTSDAMFPLFPRFRNSIDSDFIYIPILCTLEISFENRIRF